MQNLPHYRSDYDAATSIVLCRMLAREAVSKQEQVSCQQDRLHCAGM